MRIRCSDLFFWVSLMTCSVLKCLDFLDAGKNPEIVCSCFRDLRAIVVRCSKPGCFERGMGLSGKEQLKSSSGSR